MIFNMEKKIVLSSEQEECVKKVVSSFLSGKQIFTIAAPAGAGKSSIIPFIIEAMGLEDYQVAYMAYAGKASRVMRDKGMPATTIHHAIYNARKDREGRWHFRKKYPEEFYFTKLFVIDEISMVPMKLLSDVLSFKIPVLCLGDNAQLPPIGEDRNSLLDNPDFVLTKIFRQKENSGILDLATQIRETGNLNSNFNDSSIMSIKISNNEIPIDILDWSDIVLCATNKVRLALTKIIRDYRGLKEVFPQFYEPIIINRNYWDICSEKGEPLTNGTICVVKKINPNLRGAFDKYAQVELSPTYDLDDTFTCKISLNNFFNLPEVKETNRRGARKLERISCDFAYVLTVHKSQGSQFEKVVYYSKDIFGDKKKMAYTAVTRASKKLVYLQ